MSFPRYDVYKDSGVTWIEAYPRHWSLFSLRRAIDGCVNGIWGSEPDGVDDLAVMRVADFDRSRLRVSLEKLTFRSISEKERKARSLKTGDLLIEKSGGGDKTLVGCVVLFNQTVDAVTSNFVAKMTPRTGFDANFLCYAFGFLYDARVNYRSIKQTTGIQNLDSDAYLSERFVFPPFSEQQKISHFLNHETAKIDALIAEQQRLIELLKEKRQAVISHAVTKGLNPDVSMKDSGVEWLGEVPAHWSVFKLKYAIAQFEQGWSPQCDNEPVRGQDEWGVLKVGCVNGGAFNPLENKRLPDELSPRRSLAVRRGDVLVSRANTRELVGSSAVVLEAQPNLMISDKLFRINFEESRVDPRFVASYLGIDAVRHEIELAATGASSSMLNIGQATIKDIHLPRPPLDEQRQIVTHVDDAITKILELQRQCERAITVLSERKSAVISASVTGKIDVRNWKAKQSAFDSVETEAAMQKQEETV